MEALCDDPQVDTVYIATPNQFHTAHALLSLERGKHALVEKPMVLTLEDADRLIETAARHKVQLMVNVKHSFEPRIRQIREMVETGEPGRLRMLHFWYYSDWLYRPRPSEKLDPSLGDGVTWRQGPHQFDIIRTIDVEIVTTPAPTGFGYAVAFSFASSYCCATHPGFWTTPIPSGSYSISTLLPLESRHPRGWYTSSIMLPSGS